MITALILLTQLTLGCSASGCNRGVCPQCGECLIFCSCP